MKGIYCLLIKSRKSQKIKVGSIGDIEFISGCYLYVGSALNSIENRIKRHLKKNKKKFWHIDYLLYNNSTNVEFIYYIQTSKRMECFISKEVAKIVKPVKRFGSTDCNCTSHLYLIPKNYLNRIDGLLVKNLNFKKISNIAFKQDFLNFFNLEKSKNK